MYASGPTGEGGVSLLSPSPPSIGPAAPASESSSSSSTDNLHTGLLIAIIGIITVVSVLALFLFLCLRFSQASPQQQAPTLSSKLGDTKSGRLDYNPSNAGGMVSGKV
jgi:hypothetical protein